MDCPICLENKPCSEFLQFGCEHSTCSECFHTIEQQATQGIGSIDGIPACPLCRGPIVTRKPYLVAKSENDAIQTNVSAFRNFLENAGLDTKRHQIKGMEWCLRRELIPHASIKPGGVIADEMGLGKTILALGLIVSNFVDRTLVVVPPALLQQWYDVCVKFLRAKPVVYHGPQKKTISTEKLNGAPIVLTTYGMISVVKTRDGISYTGRLHEVEWGRVIYDEAHHLRNKSRKVAGALKLNAGIKWFLSGTPIQNKANDVRNVMTMLGFSESKRFSKKFLKKHIMEFTLRRTKSQVGIRLPPINYHNIHVDWMDEKERQISEEVHEAIQFTPVNRRNINRIMRELMGSCMLALFCRARQSCVYNGLFSKEKSLFRKEEEDGPFQSSKLDMVVTYIKNRMDVGNKKMVFCHFRGEIDYLMKELTQCGIDVDYIDGRKTKSERNDILHKSPDVLILQIKTACEGLNLQQYQEIHFTSPNWNPAVEDQAIARCHRIGQTKPVDVFLYAMKPFTNEYRLNKHGQAIPLSWNIDMYCREIQNVKREIMSETGFTSATPRLQHAN